MIDISPRNAKITFKRDGKEQTVSVELMGLSVKPLTEPTTYNPSQQGMATEDGATSTNQNQQASQATSGPVFGASVKGNKIVEIVAGAPAARAGLQVGDLILKFNEIGIKSAEDFSRAVDGSPATARLLIRRGQNGQINNVNVNLAK